MLVYPLAHLGDRPLRGHAHHLGERKAAARLDDRRYPNRDRQRTEDIRAMLPDHLVNERLGAGGEHQTREAAHQHQQEAESQSVAVAPDEVARFLPGVGHVRLPLRLARRIRSGNSASAAMAADMYPRSPHDAWSCHNPPRPRCMRDPSQYSERQGSARAWRHSTTMRTSALSPREVRARIRCSPGVSGSREALQTRPSTSQLTDAGMRAPAERSATVA